MWAGEGISGPGQSITSWLEDGIRLVGEGISGPRFGTSRPNEGRTRLEGGEGTSR